MQNCLKIFKVALTKSFVWFFTLKWPLVQIWEVPHPSPRQKICLRWKIFFLEIAIVYSKIRGIWVRLVFRTSPVSQGLVAGLCVVPTVQKKKLSFHIKIGLKQISKQYWDIGTVKDFFKNNYSFERKQENSTLFDWFFPTDKSVLTKVKGLKIKRITNQPTSPNNLLIITPYHGRTHMKEHFNNERIFKKASNHSTCFPLIRALGVLVQCLYKHCLQKMKKNTLIEEV